MDMKQKITKILEKANSTTSEAEAEVLMAKAKRMMEEHQVSAFELGGDPFKRTLGNKFQKGTAAQLRYDLEAGVAQYLGLHAIISTFNRRPGERLPYAVYEFVGPESGLVTFEVMFPFVWSQVLRLVREGVELFDTRLPYWTSEDLRKKLKTKYQRDLTKGVVGALLIRLQTLRETKPQELEGEGKNALIRIGGELEVFVSELFPNLVEAKDRVFSVSKEALHLAGRVSLDLQLDGGKEDPLLLN